VRHRHDNQPAHRVRPVRDGCGGTVYQATRPDRLTPSQIRAARFGWTRPFRRGLRPEEVCVFLTRLSNEVAALHAELAQARDEAHRLTEAIRRWQATHPSHTTGRHHR
jgi:DivIVA domain-containing protein